MTIALVAVGAITLAYVALIVLLARRIRRLRRELEDSLTWPSVSGTIASVGVERLGKGFLPVVSYDYAVDGGSFSGQRLNLGDPIGHGFERRASRRVRAYQPGRAVTVYLDPADPSRSCLERAVPVLRRDGVLFAIVVLVLGGLLWVLFVWLPTEGARVPER